MFALLIIVVLSFSPTATLGWLSLKLNQDLDNAGFYEVPVFVFQNSLRDDSNPDIANNIVVQRPLLVGELKSFFRNTRVQANLSLHSDQSRMTAKNPNQLLDLYLSAMIQPVRIGKLSSTGQDASGDSFYQHRRKRPKQGKTGVFDFVS